MIYFDHAATTAPSPAAIARAVELMEQVPGNPSSVHTAGLAAAEAVGLARRQVAAALGCRANEIVFTSGGTEADNLALVGAARAQKRRGQHIVTTAVEHPAVLATLSALEKEGFSVTRVPTEPDGRVTVERMLAAVTPGTVLVSCMSVCNETGARMPVEQLGRQLHALRPDILFHSDFVQSFLKERISLSDIDLCSVSAHKVHAPKGVGALYIRKGVRILPLINGGGQEGGLRSGTEAVPLIGAFGAAAEEGARTLDARADRILGLRRYADGVLSGIPGLQFLPLANQSGLFCLSMPGYRSEVVLRFLSQRDICLSAGSACAKGKKSPVLTAIGLSPTLIDGALRVSLDAGNTEAELDALAAALREAAETLVHTK